MMEKDLILDDFLERGKYNENLLPSHLALFIAIHHLLKKAGADFTVRITRKRLMHLAKIKSISTYHRCINDLVKLKYIKYEPSYDHYLGTSITIQTAKDLNQV
jgi:hypothetical protein